MRTRSLAQLILDARRDIDAAAGDARSRFITVANGQEAVYSAKLAQARQYLVDVAANAQAEVPPYVQASVLAASDRGQTITATQAAQTIANAAAAFHAGAGPAIERLREAAKAAAGAAENAQALSQIVATVRAALAAM